MNFFEVLQSSIIRDKRLELPKEFTAKYGKELSDLAIIKVLNSIWHIGLKKAEGVILFENGWPEFLEFYSICVGHVIFFRYDGNSEFQVHIFGIDATEIDYPSHIDNTNHEVEMTSTHSDEVEVLSIHSGSTQSNYEPPVSSESSLNSGSTQSNYEPSMSNESTLNQKAEPARHEFAKKSRKQKWVIPTRFHTKAFREALEAAEAFKSENPFFKVILRAYNIIRVLKVPIPFANSYLRDIKRMVITLRISDGKTWEVGYISRLAESTLSKGWYKFVADNHLKERDICVFELVDRKKIEMIVHIFRQQKTFAKKLTPKSHFTAEFQAKLEAAEEFTSENPFFKIVMQASNIKQRQVILPVSFATSHFANITQMVITLRVSDGRTWEVGYVSGIPPKRRLSQGWYKFVADNRLMEGDICVFELVDRKKIEMIVHVFRQQNPFARNYYTEEFQTTLEAAEEFISENPFFKVVLLDKHIKAGMVKVPAVFATSHLTNITRMVITLRVSDDKTWEVGYVTRRYVSRRPTEYKIAEGWREFVADNDLKEGDVCVFELVDFPKNFEMNVHIFRLEQGGID